MKKKKSNPARLGILVAILAIVALAGGLLLRPGGLLNPTATTTKKTAAATPKKTTGAAPATSATADSTPSAAETTTYTNSRFGFRLDYPLSWAAKTSVSGDGITITDPAVANLIVRVYAGPTADHDLAVIGKTLTAAEKQTHGDAVVSVSLDDMVDNHPALLFTADFTATADDVPLTGRLHRVKVATIKGDALYQVDVLAGETEFKDNESTLNALMDSLKLQ